jgi:5'-nucleotidase
LDAEKNGNLKAQGADPAFDACHADQDCDAVTSTFASPGDYVCACPEAVVEGIACETDASRTCAAGLCVLRKCRDDVAAYQREICAHAPSDALQKTCETELLACRSAGEQCKFLACVDRNLGNFSDGRLRMVGQ